MQHRMHNFFFIWLPPMFVQEGPMPDLPFLTSHLNNIKQYVPVRLLTEFHFYRKKILEILSKTTLIVMMDDPLISSNLGEFLNQIQGGLLQGSAASGMFAPKGSVLLTSNDEEVKRCGI